MVPSRLIMSYTHELQAVVRLSRLFVIFACLFVCLRNMMLGGKHGGDLERLKGEVGGECN